MHQPATSPVESPGVTGRVVMDWHSFLASSNRKHGGAAGPVPPTGIFICERSGWAVCPSMALTPVERTTSAAVGLTIFPGCRFLGSPDSTTMSRRFAPVPAERAR